MIRLATVHQRQDRLADAEDLLLQCLGKINSNSSLLKYLDFAYQHLGKCKFESGNYPMALKYFESALALRLEKGDEGLIESSKMGIEKCREMVGGCTQENWE